MFVGALLLAGCGGSCNTTSAASEESFNDLVTDINNQHPPLYDGTNNSYPPPGN